MGNAVHINYPVRVLPETYKRSMAREDKKYFKMHYDEEFWYSYDFYDGVEHNTKGRRKSTLTPHRKRPNVPFGDDEIIDLLLSAGADLNARDKVSNIIIFYIIFV